MSRCDRKLVSIVFGAAALPNFQLACGHAELKLSNDMINKLDLSEIRQKRENSIFTRPNITTKTTKTLTLMSELHRVFHLFRFAKN